MKFQENSHLTLDERVNLVFDEIKKEYPLIDDDKIYKAAGLAAQIDDKSTDDDKFDRYYILFRIIGKEDAEFPHVFNDAFQLYQNGNLSESNNKIIEDIMENATETFD